MCVPSTFRWHSQCVCSECISANISVCALSASGGTANVSDLSASDGNSNVYVLGALDGTANVSAMQGVPSVT